MSTDNEFVPTNSVCAIAPAAPARPDVPLAITLAPPAEVAAALAPPIEVQAEVVASEPVAPASPRRAYVSREVLAELRTKVWDFVRDHENVAAGAIAKALKADVKLVGYCAKTLAKVGALLPHGERRLRVYTANPAWQKPRKQYTPRTEGKAVEVAVVDFLVQQAAAFSPGVVAKVLGYDPRVVGYHCRRLARDGRLVGTGERRFRTYAAPAPVAG
jgi:hypothetical protein